MKDITTEQNIEILVDTVFEAEFSKPDIPSFIFSYKISIYNHNPFPVQVLSREWLITDSCGETTLVKGDGVVGLTPIIEANGKFEYTSNVNLQSGIGRMKGFYKMKNKSTNKLFKASIKEFKLEAKFVMN